MWHTPVASMYGIFSYIYQRFKPNVGKYHTSMVCDTVFFTILKSSKDQSRVLFVLQQGMKKSCESTMFWKVPTVYPEKKTVVTFHGGESTIPVHPL